MTITAEMLQSQLATLSEADRAALAHFLIQSLHPEPDQGAEQAWDAELNRRGEQIRSGRAKGELAEKVFSELRASRNAQSTINNQQSTINNYPFSASLSPPPLAIFD